jgi:hypothetical protein
MTSTPGVTELRNTALVQEFEPVVSSPSRIDGELWVHSKTLQLYVFSTDMDGQGTKGWIGVTSGQNTGSIVYTGDTPPTIATIFENLDGYNLGNIPLDPLPGTLWFDTGSNQLKIWYAFTTNAFDENAQNDAIGTLQQAYNGQWVSATSAHYLTDATQDIINNLQTQVASLTEQIDQLENIISGTP